MITVNKVYRREQDMMCEKFVKDLSRAKVVRAIVLLSAAFLSVLGLL